MAPISYCLKRKSYFIWTKVADEVFVLIKDKLTNAPILAFSDFDKVFKLKCDACEVRIEALLSQEKTPIAFLSEKLNEVWQKLSTYGQELYVVYRLLRT